MAKSLYDILLNKNIFTNFFKKLIPGKFNLNNFLYIFEICFLKILLNL